MMETWTSLLDEQYKESLRFQQTYLGAAASEQSIMMSALAANFAVALLLLALFIQDINKRLKLVVAAAESLSLPAAADIPVIGRDELSALSSALNTTRRQLGQATDLRARIMSEIASDIRLPLEQAKRGIRALVEANEGDRSAEAMSDLRSAEESLDRTLEIISDLLTAENLEDWCPASRQERVCCRGDIG